MGLNLPNSNTRDASCLPIVVTMGGLETMELVKMFLLTALMTAIAAAYHRAERQGTRDQVSRAVPDAGSAREI